MTTSFFGILRALICSMCALVPVCLAQAAESLDREVTFNIASQPLDAALLELSRQANVQLMVAAKSLGPQRSAGLSGKFTVNAALSSLLRGTGLKFTAVGNTVTIEPVQTGAGTESSQGSGSKSAARPLLLLAQDRSSSQMQRIEDPSGREREAKAAKEGSEDESELVVQGTRDTGVINQGVIPRQPNQALRYDIIDRAAIERSGATSIPELFRNLSASATQGTDTQRILAAQLATPDGAISVNDTVNLRGLGSGQTLVMVNGRRLFGGEDLGADLSRIPLEAIERVEVLPTSGSAIYGANAVGGVVNLVLRKDYDGSEISAYYGSADGVADERRITLRDGKRFNDNRTNVSLIAEVHSKDGLSMGDRGYAERVLARIPPTSPLYPREILRNFLSPLGNVSNASAGGLGIPGNTAATFAALTPGSTGVGLTPASFSNTAAQANISLERVNRAKLLRGSDSYSLYTTLEHSMNEGRLGAYAELSWRYSDTSTGSIAGLMQQQRLSPDPENTINPFRDDVTPGFVGRTILVSFDPVDLPRDSASSYQRSLRAVGGLKGRFNRGSDRVYNWAIDVSWDYNETYTRNRSYTRNLSSAIAAGDYNPLRDLTNAPPITGAALDAYVWSSTWRNKPRIAATNWRLNGDLLHISGGPAKFSLGLEARTARERQTIVTETGAYGDRDDAIYVDNTAGSVTERRAWAGYAEVTLPLVGERNRRPLLQGLDLIGAARYEKYSDFGAASPPMLGIKYVPFKDLALRATWSQGFQPPSPSDLAGVVETFSIAGFGYFDPVRNEEIEGDFSTGANANLKPETSDTWDAGLILTPRFAPGLTLAASYFRYDKFNVVGYLEPDEIVNMVPSRVTRAAPEPDGTPGPITFIDGTAINLARLFVDGWDYKADYVHELAGNRTLGLSADATRTKTYRRQQTPESPSVDQTGIISFLTGEGPLRWRGKMSLWLETGNMSWSWSSRYFDSYFTDTTTPTPDHPERNGVDGPKIPSVIEHDFVFNWTLPTGPSASTWREIFGGTRWTLGVLNVFDHAPPQISGRYALWYSNFNDPRQRVFYIQGRKAF